MISCSRARHGSRGSGMPRFRRSDTRLTTGAPATDRPAALTSARRWEIGAWWVQSPTTDWSAALPARGARSIPHGAPKLPHHECGSLRHHLPLQLSPAASRGVHECGEGAELLRPDWAPEADWPRHALAARHLDDEPRYVRSVVREGDQITSDRRG